MQVSMSPSRYSVIGTATYDAEVPQTMVLDAWWHLAMASVTTRHAGLGLQNRCSDTNSDTNTRN